jgi:hypothetical protein
MRYLRSLSTRVWYGYESVMADLDNAGQAFSGVPLHNGNSGSFERLSNFLAHFARSSLSSPLQCKSTITSVEGSLVAQSAERLRQGDGVGASRRQCEAAKHMIVHSLSKSNFRPTSCVPTSGPIRPLRRTTSRVYIGFRHPTLLSACPNC